MRRVLPALAGVDGCRAGWVAAVHLPDRRPELRLVQRLGDLVDALPEDAVIAVDIPIGLPERIGGPGRAAEQAGRRMLQLRRASLFSIPARAAVEAGAGPFADADERRAAFVAVCALARDRSEPPTALSIQAFGIFLKIVEVDRLLRARPELAERVVESHPELAFAVLNDGVEMRFAKKTPEGAAERRLLLVSEGFDPARLAAPVPRGVGRDDWLDACAMLLVAKRYAAGEARCFPDPPERDAHGLPIAIRV